jgi:hypothetical protein
MPQSDHWAVPWVVEVIDRLQPKSVFDFGVGNGQFGLHIRQILDIGHDHLKPQDWQVRLEGVEIFENYRNPIWDYFYDCVHIGDGAEVLRKSDQHWDVLLICDVIEHFPKAKALELIELLRSKATTVIVTTPNGVFPQGNVHGNEAERHLSEWRPGDFQALGATTRPISSTFLAVFSQDRSTQRMVSKIPALFHHTGRELVSLTREWFPHMLRSRLSRVP